MKLFDAITQEEKYAIESYIERYALHGTSMRETLEVVLKEWSKKKTTLYKLLGDNLIISKEVTVAKDIDTLITDLRNKCTGPFLNNYEKWVWDNVDEGKWELYSLTALQTLVENKYGGQTTICKLHNGDIIKLMAGSKVMKTLQKIANKYNIGGFEEFRLIHSQVLNDSFLRGQLTLSIHPMDYMTMSDNNSSWSSCMSWEEEGDYCLGTVEMMNSPIVVEAYMAREEDMSVPGGYDWNNKRWRELFVINEKCIAGIKGYPYWNRELEGLALEWLKELAATNLGWTYNIRTTLRYDDDRTPIVAEDGWEYFIYFTTNHMYNDFYSRHEAYVNIDQLDESSNYIHYSGKATCMGCGADLSDCDNPHNALACDTCYERSYCYNCGCVVDDNDDYFEVDGERVCQDCYYDMPVCDITGTPHFDSHLRSYEICYNGKLLRDRWNCTYSIYVCEDGIDELKAQDALIKDDEYIEFTKLSRIDASRLRCYYPDLDAAIIKIENNN